MKWKVIKFLKNMKYKGHKRIQINEDETKLEKGTLAFVKDDLIECKLDIDDSGSTLSKSVLVDCQAGEFYINMEKEKEDYIFV